MTVSPDEFLRTHHVRGSCRVCDDAGAALLADLRTLRSRGASYLLMHRFLVANGRTEFAARQVRKHLERCIGE